MTLVFVINLYESLDTIWHPRWLPKKKHCIGVFFIHKYIFKIFMSEICFNCNECCFLYIIYNFEIFLTVDSSMASKMAAKMENSIYW